MDKNKLFSLLKKKEADVWFELLQNAYDEMNDRQRKDIFGYLFKEAKPEYADGQKLLKKIKKFHKDSLNGKYFAPFDVNSKNFMNIPEETDEWCDCMGEFLDESIKLTEQGDHLIAIDCFVLLKELIDLMDDGDIVFADEIGSWMIPCDQKQWIKAYATSLAINATPEEFTKAMLPIIHSDSIFSFANKAYSLITNVAKKEQKAHLEAEIKKQNVKTHPQ